MKDIIVSTWGIGPAYRNRVKYNIEKAINSGYDNVLPYIILTDKPKDFYQFQDKYKNHIIDIVNINSTREQYSPWSKEFEFIPQPENEKDYGKEYREKNYNEKKYFSYGMHRFVLPRISELNYNKFIFCDSDTDIRYDRIVNGEITESEFWREFDIPVNTMKGCDFEIMQLNYGNWQTQNVIMGNILRFHLLQTYPQYCKTPHLHLLNPTHTQTEGPFRFYHLDNSDTIKKYFELWDEATKISMSHRDLKHQISPGCYMFIDNILVTATNDMLGIKIEGFPRYDSNNQKKIHKVNIFREDRYFFPTGIVHTVNGKHLSLQPADSLEEFNEINKELINHLKLINDWDK